MILVLSAIRNTHFWFNKNWGRRPLILSLKLRMDTLSDHDRRTISLRRAFTAIFSFTRNMRSWPLSDPQVREFSVDLFPCRVSISCIFTHLCEDSLVLAIKRGGQFESWWLPGMSSNLIFMGHHRSCHISVTLRVMRDSRNTLIQMAPYLIWIQIG